MPSTKCWDGRGSTEQRLEEGCIQLTPATSGCWEERSPLFGNSSYSHRTTHRALRCRTPCYGQEWFGTKWSLSPSPRAALTLTALCRERFLALQRFERVARDGDEIPAWECSPLRSPTEPTPWAKHSCRGRRCCPPLPALQPPKHAPGSQPARADTDRGLRCQARGCPQEAQPWMWPGSRTSLHWHHAAAAPGSSCVRVVPPCRECSWDPWAVP